jgi:Xaa-Pro aminopeptidase
MKRQRAPFPLAWFQKRREQFFKNMKSNSIAIVPNRPVCLQCPQFPESKITAEFDRDFFYLTGLTVEKAFAVFMKISSRKKTFILFIAARDLAQEKWGGATIGPTEAIKQFRADEAYPIDEFQDKLMALLLNKQKLYYPLGRYDSMDKQIMNIISVARQRYGSYRSIPTTIEDVSPILHDMRLFKTVTELKAMKKAAKITSRALTNVMRACKPGLYEYELSAMLSSAYESHASSKAFPTIVAGGKNACTLHYEKNNAVLKSNDLVLIDTGATYQYYASDVSRTFPVNGRFTPVQKKLYQLVLVTQLAVIKAIRPGVAFNQLQLIAIKQITQGLLKLGLLKGQLDKLIKARACRSFFPHGISHWLGLDVHDVGERRIRKKWRILEAGMVLTVEPGIYIPDTLDGVDKKWHNIGIRIEDDVVVTQHGHQVISNAPKTISAIEKIMEYSG